MLKLYRIGPLKSSAPPDRTFLSDVDSIESAIAHLTARGFGATYEWEEDSDYPGCFDILSARGELFTVENKPWHKKEGE